MVVVVGSIDRNRPKKIVRVPSLNDDTSSTTSDDENEMTFQHQPDSLPEQEAAHCIVEGSKTDVPGQVYREERAKKTNNTIGALHSVVS